MVARTAAADRMARARTEFAEAMARGCTILQLRAAQAEERLALRHRARVTIADHTADLMAAPPMQRSFLNWGSPWMGRD
mgnify:CR=1 FL=1